MTSVSTTRVATERARRPIRGTRLIDTALLGCGAAIALVYIAADLICASRYPGYRMIDQTISELSAQGAPTAELWARIMYVYEILTLALAVGVVRVARDNRALSVVGWLLLAAAITGPVWAFFPMHQRGATGTWQDVGHIVLGGVTVALMLAYVACGAFALGRRFRAYSFATLAALFVGGLASFAYASRVAANAPTPWLGIVERVNVYGDMIWLSMLAIVLLRTMPTRDGTHIPR